MLASIFATGKSMNFFLFNWLLTFPSQPTGPHCAVECLLYIPLSSTLISVNTAVEYNLQFLSVRIREMCLPKKTTGKEELTRHVDMVYLDLLCTCLNSCYVHVYTPAMHMSKHPQRSWFCIWQMGRMRPPGWSCSFMGIMCKHLC